MASYATTDEPTEAQAADTALLEEVRHRFQLVTATDKDQRDRELRPISPNGAPELMIRAKGIRECVLY